MDVTVLVPTHDHGRLLGPAVRSALRQTVADLEVLVLGDGVTDETRETALALVREDDRVRFLDLPKGERLGEARRHAVLLEEARAPVVAYLCDDDLWLPEHVERLLVLLEDADWAHALSVWTNADGAVCLTTLDVATPFGREAVATGRLTPGLSTAGHRMDAYRRLPHGWRTTPQGTPTDQWMWRQWLGEPWVRAASGKVPTLVHLPSPQRRDWSLERRMAELEQAERDIADPAWRLRYAEAVAAQLLDESAWYAAQTAHLEAWGKGLERQLVEVWEDRARLYERLEG